MCGLKRDCESSPFFTRVCQNFVRQELLANLRCVEQMSIFLHVRMAAFKKHNQQNANARITSSRLKRNVEYYSV